MKLLVLPLLLLLTSTAVADDNKIHPKCIETETNRQCWVEHGSSTGPRLVSARPYVPEAMPSPPPPPPQYAPPPMMYAEPPPPPPQWIPWRLRVSPYQAGYYCGVGVARYCE